LGIAVALVLVVTGIAVSWESIKTQRQQQADFTTFQQRQAEAPVIGAPPPDHPHAGS
jgi:hypothetical protein